jgi:UDP-N-acetyl-2-amino-2-deoxyglucuronate dehydrogenase
MTAERGSAESPFRIALVGCGRISRNHFEALRRVDGLALSAVCDVVAERAAAAGEEQGVPWYASYDEMLAAAECDAVAICTPSGLHPRHGIAAAARGKHVISEKPMATRLDEADALVDACDRAGVQLFVVKQNRLNPSVQLLRRAVDKGRFGRIYMANTTVRWSRPQ